MSSRSRDVNGWHWGTKAAFVLFGLILVIGVASILATLVLDTPTVAFLFLVFLIISGLQLLALIAFLIGRRGPRERSLRGPIIDPANDPSWPPVMTGVHRPIDKPSAQRIEGTPSSD